MRQLCITLAFVSLSFPALAQKAQPPRNNISSGLGFVISTEGPPKILVDASADWHSQPLFVSLRLAAAGTLFGSQIEEVGIIVGPSTGGETWSLSAGAGIGLAWLFKPPPLFGNPGSNRERIGPVASLPITAEAAIYPAGPLFVRFRAIASMNAKRSFVGINAGFGLSF